MPYQDVYGDFGNDFTALLGPNSLLDLPPSLKVAMLSIPFKPKAKNNVSSFSPAPLQGLNPQHLRSLVLTTGILEHNVKVCLSS